MCWWGGRFDPGMLYYMPQIWTSDDSDAIERLTIQKGTSMVYPAISMGAHVSASPNHQVGRITGIETRSVVAMQGTFGYELDLTKLSDLELAVIKNQITKYKKTSSIIQFGDLYRLKDNDNEQAWMYLYQKQVLVSYVQILAKPNTVPKRLKLKGLK